MESRNDMLLEKQEYAMDIFRTNVLTANPNKTEKNMAADNILTQFHGIVAQEH